MTTQPVRFGLIGYGPLGLQHARAIERSASARLMAIAVLAAKSQQEARQNHPEVEVLADTDELLARTDIDVAVIVVPSQIRFATAKAALAAGKHVLLEKPIALQVAHCDELVHLAQASGRVLCVAHELRWSPLWGTVRQLIDEGKLGRVQHVLIELARPPYRQNSAGWRQDPQRSGSWVFEEPLQFFDLAQWYLEAAGPPESVYARASSRHTNLPGQHDNFTAVINFPGNKYAVVSQTLVPHGQQQSLKLAGTEGALWAQWNSPATRGSRPACTLRYGLGDDQHEICFTTSAGQTLEFEAQIEAMCQSVRHELAPWCAVDQGRWASVIALAVQQALESGEVIDVGELVNCGRAATA